MSIHEARTLDDLETPCAVVDLDRMEANLNRVAAYAAEHGLALRPHTKTHKAAWILAEQVRRGAVGATVATPREAEAMAAATDDILVAYPPVGPARIRRLLELPPHVRLTVALDSAEALDALADAAGRAGREVGVLVELDVGMGRCGVPEPAQALALARRAAERDGVAYRGVLFYPGHIREHVDGQEEPLAALNTALERHLDILTGAGLAPEVVSGGSTPALFASHRVRAQTEIRPGTYVFNDRTTAVVGACRWDEIAYTILATVVSTAVPGQAVTDAGSKALSREEIRGAEAPGLGALLGRPEVPVRTSSEEHGVLDLSASDWRPRVGERVQVVPNHVCVSVNLQERIWGVRDGRIERVWEVEARGRARRVAGAA